MALHGDQEKDPQQPKNPQPLEDPQEHQVPKESKDSQQLEDTQELQKFGQITQNSPNFKSRGREIFGPNFWPNFLFSQILAENSPNYQSSVLISIIFSLG